MSYQYFFPQVTTGYRWNLLKRCLYEMGVEPLSICDMNDQTVLEFHDELDAFQKDALEEIMKTDPQNANPEWDFVELLDIEAVIDMFREQTGIFVMPFYAESEKGSGVFDRIRLCVKGKLTDAQKLMLYTAYCNLFSK